MKKKLLININIPKLEKIFKLKFYLKLLILNYKKRLKYYIILTQLIYQTYYQQILLYIKWN